MHLTSPEEPEIRDTLHHVRAWVKGNGLALNRTETGLASLEDALFTPLEDETRQQFAAGAGGELNRMHSLRSSSALCYNVFAAWKPDPTPIARLLRGVGAYNRIRFEAQYPTGVSSRHPHLDVVLEGGEIPIAVESKYLEIYDDPKPAVFSTRYLASDTLWEGLSNLRSLAISLADGTSEFGRLGAAQLVKHTLGLAHWYGVDGFRLVYLWYDVPGESADDHRNELNRFAKIAAQDISFAVYTYQQLFQQIARLDEPAPRYFSYLRGRYFDDDQVDPA